MGRETLSVNQANSIISSMNEIVRDCCIETERANDEFVEELSRVWADQNAVDFARMHKQNVSDMINNLNSNNEKYINTVTEIANAYINAGGGNKKINPVISKPMAAINVDRVKEYFSHTENADDFGFINPETGVDTISAVYAQYEKKIQRISLDTSKKIQHINAFGNNEVQLALAGSAGKIVDIFLEGVKTETNQLREAVDKTAKNYIAVGRAINGIESNQMLYGPAPGGSSVSRTDDKRVAEGEYKPNQVLYGPAPGGSSVSRTDNSRITEGEFKPNQVLYGPAPGGISSSESGTIGIGEQFRPNQVLYGPAPGGSSISKIDKVGIGEQFRPNQVLYGPAPRGEIRVNKADSND